MFSFVFLLSALVLHGFDASPVDKPVRFDGHEIWRLHPNTEQDIKVLKELQESALGVDFWVQPTILIPVDVRVPPPAKLSLKTILDRNDISYEVTIHNLQELVDKEKQELPENQSSAAAMYISCPSFCKRFPSLCSKQCASSGSLPKKTKGVDRAVGEFVSFGMLDAFIGRMENQYPDIVSHENIGASYEGRTMKLIKISTGGANKPIAWIESGIHAREWLTVASSIYIVEKICREHDSDNDVRNILNTFDVYVIAIANPDGYEYTRYTDRLWRKTRKPSSSRCYGTDPNRNWDFHWGVSGTSRDPCSSTYGGPNAFSEPEVVNMKNAILNIRDRIKLFFSLHSYSQLWLTPWAYSNVKPVDNAEMLRVATIGNNALFKKHGKRFTVGSPADILYAASGGSYDWAKGVAGVKYSYTLELRPSRFTSNGFIVDKSEIIPSGEEVFASFAASLKAIASTLNG